MVMHLLKKDFRAATKVKPQSPDDLWALRHIIAEGDIIGAKTMRTITAEKREKKPTFLKLKAERLEFDETGQHLRIGGEIVAAAEKFARGQHTFSISPSDIITIEKPEGWRDHQKRRLQDSLAYRTIRVLICVLDDREADFALATELRLKPIAHVRNSAGGKRYGAKEMEAGAGQFFKDITDVLQENAGRVDRIVLAGPGFTKDELVEKLPPELEKKVVLEGASVTGETGLNEVVKRGALDKIVKGTRISKETELVEKFLLGIARQGLVTHKPDKIALALELGAIETLLVADRLLPRPETEKLLLDVEKKGGAVFIISTTHEAGERLLGLGGLGAFLRYKI